MENIKSKPLTSESTANNSLFRDMYRDWTSSWKDAARTPAPLQNIMAGFTVAAVAVPLNIALAVVCGLPPITGLVAGAIGGFFAGIFGGAPFQVTGPAAALNVMVLALTVKFGPVGVAAACILIGLVQLALMSMSAGNLVRFVPESLLAGFTTGVGIKIMDSQIPEFLGFDYRTTEIAAMMHQPEWLNHVSWLAVVCGLFVSFCVIAFKEFKRFPAALVGIVVITAVSVKLGWSVERVGEIPSSLPPIALPQAQVSTWLAILVTCFPLAVLAAVESLLSAQALDRMTNAHKPHNSNLELLGQGAANLASGFFGGMPVSGVIVRSSVNIQSGAKSRLSTIVHAIILIVCIVYLSHLLELIPLAALAGLLCIVGWRLIEIRTLVDLIRSNRWEATAFLCAAVGTMTGHLVLGLVSAGVVSFIEHKLSSRKSPDTGIALETTRQTAIVIPSFSAGEVIGDVTISPTALVSEQASLRAENNCSIRIGAHCDLMQGVKLWAHTSQSNVHSSLIAKIELESHTTIARNTDLRGSCRIGAHSFVGVGSVIENANIGAHCFIGSGAKVSNVDIPEGRIVPHGANLNNQNDVNYLQKVGQISATDESSVKQCLVT